MLNKKTVNLLILFLVTIAFSGCVPLDDYLETSLNEEPKVIFEQELFQNNADMLLLMGIEDANIVNRIRKQRLDFYINNTKEALIDVDVLRGINTKYLRFAEMYGENLDVLTNEFPQLAGMNIFVLCSKGMKVNANNLRVFQTLSDGE